jgi:hypothetical protein
MQGLAARLALRLNQALRRKGTFWADRYHCRELVNPLEVRRALVYVLANHRKHERALRPGIDPFSSGIWFRAWREARPLPLSLRLSAKVIDLRDPPVLPAQTWLLASGWKQHGLVSVKEGPLSM